MTTKLQLVYHPDDVVFAARVAMDLLVNGISIHADFFIPEAQRGTRKDASGYIVILSPNFTSDLIDGVPAEGMNVFPIVKSSIETWPKRLRRDLAIDFMGWGDRERYNLHLNELIHIIKLHTSIEAYDLSPIEKHIYRTMTTCARAAIAYQKLGVQTDRISSQDNTEEAIVIRENDNLGEQIARQAQETLDQDAITTSKLISYPTISALFEEHKRFILVGRDGVGKTTALMRLALESAWRWLEDNTKPIPAYLDLWQWESGEKLNRYLASQLPDVVIKQLQGQSTELFIDHLDGTDTRNWAQLIRWLQGDDSPNTVGVGVDVRLYNGELNIPVVIIEQDQSLPIFFQQKQTQLKKPAAIINQTVATTTKPEQLQRLATRMLEEDILYGTTRQWTINQITEKRGLFGKRQNSDQEQNFIATWIEENILTEAGENIKFSHNLYRDYFAALSLINNGIGNIIKVPQFDDQRRLPTRWDQPIIFATQLLDDASTFILDIARTDPFLALGCIESGAIITSSTQEKLTKLLLDVLTQNDWRQSLAAIAGLKRLNETALIEHMIELMAYGDLYERRLATRVFGELRHPAGIPLLVDALHDEAIRNYAQQSLINIGPDALPDVARLVNPDIAPRWETRMAAVHILQNMADERAIPILIETLFDETDEVLWAAANALAAMGKAAIQPLITLIKEARTIEDQTICSAAAMAIIWTDEADGVVQLASLLDDTNPLRRAVVADTLGGATGTWLPLAVSKLAERLHDTSVVELDGEILSIAEIAVRSLEAIGTPEALRIVKDWNQQS